MRFDYISTAIQANVTAARDSLELAYERLPDTTLFWGMIDLCDSSNYRLVRGAKEGYIRGETFFSLVHSAIAPCTDIRLLKEIGDAVFLASKELRPMLESVIVIDQVTHQIAAIAGTKEFPFSVRSAIGYGTAKRLVRQHEDFLGHPIDRLARIMGVRTTLSTILIDDEAYRASGDIICDEYGAFVTVSESIQVSEDITKGMGRLVTYRALQLNRENLMAFHGNFVPWHYPKASGRTEGI